LRLYQHLDLSDISSKIADLFGSASSDGFPKLRLGPESSDVTLILRKQ
jgi:hypothetical protein